MAARVEVEQLVEYMRSFDRLSVRTRIGKAGGEYLEQIDAIRDRYSFSQIPRRKLDQRQSLLAFVRKQEAQGEAISVPDALITEARKQHFKDTTLEELVGVRDAVKQIAHLARTKNLLLASARAREMDEARDEIRSAIGMNYSLKLEAVDISKPLADRLKHGTRRALGEHTRMEFLFEHLDGHQKRGPVWQYFFKPFADAEDAENTMRRADAQALSAIFSAYTKAERADWFVGVYTIPGTATDQIANSFTKANILAVALNWGNEYNRSALMEGYGWSEPQVERILKQLDDRDWRTVQAIWDHIDTYWPAAEQLEKDVTGLAPEKVERAPFRTPSGLEMSGGYYPVAFDREQSSKQAALDEAASVTDMFGGLAAKAMTRHGHLKERTNTGGKPIKLELGVLSDHLASVVHDLAFRRAVIDVSRLTRDDTIRETIEAAAGREMYQQLGPWLKGIAGDRAREPITVIEKLLARARMGATVVALGLKVTSSLVQTLGFTLTVKEIGPRYATAGMREMFGHGTPNPFRLVKPGGFIAERSAMMRDRIGGFDRDVRDATRRPEGLIPGIDPSAWFAFVGYMDLGTSIPTWLGAYRKAMDGAHPNVEKGDEKAAIDYADSVVRTTQAAGAAKDLATVQRGGEAWRFFTTFYSSMSILFNQFQSTQQEFALTKDVPKLIASLALVWFLPAVLEDAIRGRAPSDDDPDELLAWLLRKEILYPFTTVIGVRDIANAIDRGMETGQVDSSNAFTNLVESIAKLGISLGDELQGEASTRADYRNAANVVGQVAHLPSRQIWTTGSYLYDWMTGATHPTGPFDFLWHAAATGTPKRD